MTTRIPYVPLPIDQSDVIYEHGPDSVRRDDGLRGTTTELTIADSTIYPGTERTVWVHTPGTATGEPLPVMIFQDGWWYLDPDDDVRGSIVLDNLIRDGGIPPMIGVFVEAGVFPNVEDPRKRKNRNVEYDAFDDRYALVSSFAQIPGGNPYPELIAGSPRKPLRIFLQENHRDLGWNEPEDNWLAENLRTAAALAEAAYDFRFVLGEGGHTGNQGGVLLPDALRWLWRD